MPGEGAMAHGFLAAIADHDRRKQQQFQNERALARDAESDRRYQAESGYRRQRDTTLDDRFDDDKTWRRDWMSDDRNYTRGRHKIGDKERADERQYQRGQDTWRRGITEEEVEYRKDQDAIRNERQTQAIETEQDRYDDQIKYRDRRDAVNDALYEKRFKQQVRQYQQSRSNALEQLELQKEQLALQKNESKARIEAQKIEQMTLLWERHMPILASLSLDGNLPVVKKIYNSLVPESERIESLNWTDNGLLGSSVSGNDLEISFSQLEGLERMHTGNIDPSEGQFTLSPGAIRYDAQGKPIAQNPGSGDGVRKTQSGSPFIDMSGAAGVKLKESMREGILNVSGFAGSSDGVLGALQTHSPYVQSAADDVADIFSETLVKYHNEDKLNNRWPTYYNKMLGDAIGEAAKDFDDKKIKSLQVEAEELYRAETDPQASLQDYVNDHVKSAIGNRMSQVGHLILQTATNRKPAIPRKTPEDSERKPAIQMDESGAISSVDFTTQIYSERAAVKAKRELDQSNAQAVIDGFKDLPPDISIDRIQKIRDENLEIKKLSEEAKYIIDSWIEEKRGEESEAREKKPFLTLDLRTPNFDKAVKDMPSKMKKVLKEELRESAKKSPEDWNKATDALLEAIRNSPEDLGKATDVFLEAIRKFPDDLGKATDVFLEAIRKRHRERSSQNGGQ